MGYNENKGQVPYPSELTILFWTYDLWVNKVEVKLGAKR